MKLQKYIIIVLSAFSVLHSSLKGGAYFVYYVFDTEGFVEKYCENKQNPSLHCDGKCKLTEISKENNAASHSDFNFDELKMDFIWILELTSVFTFIKKENLIHTFHYNIRYCNGIFSTIFHPPAV